MRSGFDLPPLMFTREEAQALVASVRVARSRFDDALAGHADAALSKILAVLPAASRAAAESMAVLAPAAAVDAATRARLGVLREAAEARRKVRIAYLDLKGSRTSERVVRPLGCVFWGEVWTLAAWCESREGFRNFRIDRIDALEVQDGRFRDEPGKTLADLLRAVGADRPRG
jgi:predicted DNA-binding transcriptional regulator YafY